LVATGEKTIAKTIKTVGKQVPAIAKTIKSVGKQVLAIAKTIKTVGKQVLAIAKTIKTVGKQVLAIAKTIKPVGKQVLTMDFCHRHLSPPARNEAVHFTRLPWSQKSAFRIRHFFLPTMTDRQTPSLRKEGECYSLKAMKNAGRFAFSGDCTPSTGRS
jgi:hypothetical protein